MTLTACNGAIANERPTSTPPLKSVPSTATTIPPTASPVPATATPMILVTVTCADLDPLWGTDWPGFIETVDLLLATGQTCGAEPLLTKKYAALFSYGKSLEEKGQIEQAVEQFQTALLLDPERPEALRELTRLDRLPAPTPPACLSDSSPLPDPSSPEPIDTTTFVTAMENQLMWQGEPFTITGVNYYPRHAPWHRFIDEVDLVKMTEEFDLIQQAGFNTVRVFLRYQSLFTCQPEAAIPNEAAFAKIDTLFQLATERQLKLIVTLNDLPDLVFRPLYTDWAHYDNQTRYIVRRYRHETAILAWDLRNEGDIDYGAQTPDKTQATQEDVMVWLAHISDMVRAEDPHHLLTAGWWGNPLITEPYVDLLSFHHWTTGVALQQRIDEYQAITDKPLLLQEVGYTSWSATPPDVAQETAQAQQLAEAITVTESANISGWVVWTAFDFVPPPGAPTVTEHFFGLWRTDLSPKPGLAVVSPAMR